MLQYTFVMWHSSYFNKNLRSLKPYKQTYSHERKQQNVERKCFVANFFVLF